MTQVDSYSNNIDKRVNGGSHREEIREVATHMKEEIGKVGRIARDATQEQLTELQKMGSEQIDRLAVYAKERPLTSLAIAAAVGFFGAGFLLRR